MFNRSPIEIFFLIILFILSLGSFIIGYLHFKEKGILFNNAYIYASKEERKTMNKKPHYRQSAIVFTTIGSTFLLIALEMMIQSKWLFYIVYAELIFLIFYAIISSIRMNKDTKKK